MRIKRSRPYVKVLMYSNSVSIREIVERREIPTEQYEPKEDGTNAVYIVGPFRTNAGALMFKNNPGKYKTVTEAEKAAARVGME
jgi:hypothetical protein